MASLIQMSTGLVLVVCMGGGWHTPLVLVSLAGIQGFAGAAVAPAVSAMVPDLVPKGRTAHAALLEGVSWNAGRALGPIIAVFIVHVGSYSAVFLLNAMSFIGVSIALYLVHARPPQCTEGGTLTKRFSAGWNGLRHNAMCWWGTIIATVEISLIAPFIALIPVMGQLVLHESSGGSGLLFLGQGMGSALGLVLAGTLMHHFGTGRLFLGMMVVLPALLTAYALSPNLVCAVAVIVPLSGAHSIVLALAISFTQRFAGDVVRGRVIGLHRAVTITSYAIASSVLAVVANEVGLRTTLIAISASTVVFLLWMLAYRRTALHAIAATNEPPTHSSELDPVRERFPPTGK